MRGYVKPAPQKSLDGRQKAPTREAVRAYGSTKQYRWRIACHVDRPYRLKLYGTRRGFSPIT